MAQQAFGIPFTHFMLEDRLLSTVRFDAGSWWLDHGSNGCGIVSQVQQSTAVRTCKSTWAASGRLQDLFMTALFGHR